MSSAEIVRLKNSVTERDHASGAATALVTLLEYGNFECIHCGRAYPIIKEVQKLLGDNLRFVFRHFPTVQTHPHSLRAAEAAEAAGAQGKFWEMHDQLFTHQQALEDHDLSRYAGRIGLEVERFARDLSENTFLKKIEDDYKRSLFDEHVTGTPTFYINEGRYTGATDVESLLVAIKQADTEGRIRVPQRPGAIRGFLDKLHRPGNG
jgi:formate-nitrite transporter family protein